MVKRWKEEIILAVTLVVCATGGGYLGGKMAQMATPPVHPAVSQGNDIFGTLPPVERPLAPQCVQPTVIMIFVNPPQAPQRAVYQLDPPLNPIQSPVNFI